MRHHDERRWMGIAGAYLIACLALLPGVAATAWQDTFKVEKAALADTGRGPYFVLEPGYTLEYAHGSATLVVTVLAQTQVVDGVRTRVVEERESEKGALVEISRNYVAIDPATGDLYYFGEDVDIYNRGTIVGHEGAWRSGVGAARFGLLVKARPALGDRYYQEIAPGVAMDRVEVVSLDATITTPAGTFRDCLAVKETSPLEAGVSRKAYAAGVGLVRDDEFTLVRITKP